jgi:nicotinate-nucleotide--dimethylbenzimidazole phosphoribosyltransferase
MIQPASLSLLPSPNPQESAVSAVPAEVAFDALLMAGVAAGALVETDGGKAIPESGKILPDLPVEVLPAAPAEAGEAETAPQLPTPPARMLPVGEALKLAAKPAVVALPTQPRHAAKALDAELADPVQAKTDPAAEPAIEVLATRIPQARIALVARTSGSTPAPTVSAEPQTEITPTALPVAEGEEPQPPVAWNAEPTTELPAVPPPVEISQPVQSAPVASAGPAIDRPAPVQPQPIRPLAARDRAPIAGPNAEKDRANAAPAEEAAPVSPPQLPQDESEDALALALPPVQPVVNEPVPAEPARTDAAPAEPVAVATETPIAPLPAALPLPVAETAAPDSAPAAAPRRAMAAPKFERPPANRETAPAPQSAPPARARVAANDAAAPAHVGQAAPRATAPEAAAVPQPAVAPETADRIETRGAPAAPQVTAAPRSATVTPAAGQVTIEIDLPSRTPNAERAPVAKPSATDPAPLGARPVRAMELPSQAAAPQLPATPVAQAPVAPQAADGTPAKPAIPNDLLPSPGQEKRAAVGPGQPELQGARSFTAPSLPLPPLQSQAVAPANFSIPAGDASVALGAPAPTAQPVTAPTPRAHDVSALVDRLVEAREAARGETLHIAVHNKDFGQVSLRFTQDSGGLTVAVANDDPDFARAVRTAIPAGEARDGNAASQGDRRDFGGTQGGRAQPDSPGAGGEDTGRRGRSDDTAGQPRTRHGARPDSPSHQDATTPAMGGILA